MAGNTLTISSGDAAAAQSVANKVARFGACSTGTPAAVYEYERGGDAVIVGDLGYGSVVEETKQALRLTGGVGCVVVPVDTDIAGVIGSVTEDPAGTGPSVTLSGDPTMDLPRLALKMSRGGPLGEAQVSVAYDGYTYAATFDVPEQAPGVVTGTVDVTTLTLSALNAQTLVLSPDGGSNQTVTFTTPPNVGDIVTQINNGTTGMTASLIGGRYLRIASDTTGTASAIQVQASSTADTTLGLDNAAHAGSAATVALTGTGLTATFPSGTYIKDTVYFAQITGPRFSVTSLGAAMDALKESGVEVGVVSLSQVPLDAAEALSFYSALKSKLTAWRSADEPWYAVAFMPMPLGGTGAVNTRTNDLSVRSAFAGIVDELGSVTRVHGDIYLEGSDVLGLHRRSLAVPLSIRAAGASLSEDPGSGELPSLPECSLIGPDGETLARNENTASVKMQASGFTVLEKRDGLPYFYRGVTSALSSSKFKHLGIVRMGFFAARLAWAAMQKKRNITRDLAPDGKLQPADRANLASFYKAELEGPLVKGPQKHASAVRTEIPDADMRSTTRYALKWEVQHRAQLEAADAALVVTGAISTDRQGNTTQTVS